MREFVIIDRPLRTRRWGGKGNGHRETIGRSHRFLIFSMGIFSLGNCKVPCHTW